MGLDLGGGSARCLLLEVASRTRRLGLPALQPHAPPGVPMGSDFDAEATWSLLGEASREALARAGAAPGDVLGVAATSMRHGSVLLDAQGRVLLATPNRDARGLAPVLELAARHGDDAAPADRALAEPGAARRPPALAREPRPRAARARGMLTFR